MLYANYSPIKLGAGKVGIEVEIPRIANVNYHYDSYMIIKALVWDFPGRPMQWTRVSFLVGELRSHMPHAVWPKWKKKKKKKLWSGSHNFLLGNTHPYLPVFVGRLSVNCLSSFREADWLIITSHPLDPEIGLGLGTCPQLSQSPDLDRGREMLLWFIPGYLSVIMVQHRHSQGPFLPPHRRRETKGSRGARRELRKLEVGVEDGNREWRWGRVTMTRNLVPNSRWANHLLLP